jgi:hypothetical protein
MKIKSEKQSSNVHEPGAEGGSSPLPFDPEKYRKYLAETGWSEKAQDEYLETLWNMMGTKSFGPHAVSFRATRASPFLKRSEQSRCPKQDPRTTSVSH